MVGGTDVLLVEVLRHKRRSTAGSLQSPLRPALIEIGYVSGDQHGFRSVTIVPFGHDPDWNMRSMNRAGVPRLSGPPERGGVKTALCIADRQPTRLGV